MKLSKTKTLTRVTYLSLMLTTLLAGMYLSVDAQAISELNSNPSNFRAHLLESNVETPEIETPQLLDIDPTVAIPMPTPEPAATTETRKIQIALILDTSGSMEGLIEQAKSQLWGVVSEMTHAKCDGKDPMLEIALYEYGNDGISSSNGYVRRILSLNSDLDAVSRSLFALRTNGGSEFCGTVIQKSLTGLEWSKSDKDIKMIFIAGNEPFTQGRISYESACGNARENGVVVNTIHCGSYEEGVRGMWKSGALIGGGDYMAIQHNRKTIYVETPYDDRINKLGVDLNKTYIYYGAVGRQKKVAQEQEDANAAEYSQSNLATRNSIKASKYYRADSWDLVDAVADSTVMVKEVTKSSLPKELQSKSTKELEVYVAGQAKKRAEIQSKIATLNKQRSEYVAKQNTSGETNLESSMINAIKKQANGKNYTW